MDARRWTHFEHEADIGLAATSDSREGLFEAMGAALTGVVTDPAIVQPRQRIRIQCSADDDGLLMFDWINSLIYEMATRRMLFGAWQVTLRGCDLDAQVEGEPVHRERHQPAVEVKGATCTELHVERDATGQWRAQCVVDV